ncbi:hypothetical protein ACIBIZ_11990 [Nonomuraea spiralis]|uniref:Uncharacterized protein n=1 Tax=Nonomuraea spiralis TaxID=46182 RepID=A0ABV5INM6_9ACTN|nr:MULTISPECIES: hypothetical protein [Nonomuraea]RSM98154.1 hypothetical protein DMB42_44910 [Nonomuraea sp. WAC 01424]GGT26020.1 hypothetical protein GCM10010176_083320 [Nonomuraea spiralis]
MRLRRLTTAALVAGGLALGAVAGSAVPASAQQAAGSWHVAGYYQYRDQCTRAGFTALTSGGIVQDFKCELSGSRFALSLFY